MTANSGYGFLDPTATNSEFNKIAFTIQQMIARLSITKLVQVKAVSTSGGLSPTGTVSVLPLVSQIDGQGNVFAHGTIFNVPYFRLQGGTNAVICDPAVGDVGFIVICDRDTSAAKNTQIKNSGTNPSSTFSPGSFRQNDLADSIFIGGCLNATPKQYVQINGSGIVVADANNNTIAFTPSGIKATDGNGNTFNMENGQIAVTCTVLAVTGNITATGTIKAEAGASFVGLSTHEHSGTNTPPTPGI